MAITRGGLKSISPPASALKKRPAASEVADNAPAKKRGRPPKKSTAKKQATIEDTMDVNNKEGENKHETKVGNNGASGKIEAPKNESDSQKLIDNALNDIDSFEDDAEIADQIEEEKTNDSKKMPDEHVQFDTKKESDGGARNNNSHAVKNEKEQESKSESIARSNESVIEDPKREATIPSSILEKGVIYFFFRGRVGIEDPQGIEDVARSYIVLRPLPIGAKLGDGPLEDSGNARLLALPKKMLPKSDRDRFLMFTEKVQSSVKNLRDQFAGNEYDTKTYGTRNTPAATPFAEGVYAITSTGRESHLAYQLTVPSKIGEVQTELGLNERGSFVCSVKNPEAPGPANATIGNPAKYPEQLQKKFRGLRWMPLEPEHLEYEGTQLLVIGEGFGSFGKAVEGMTNDKKDGEKEKPEEEIEKLEEEDHARVENLKEDDPVFADLGLSSKEYSGMETTW